MRWYRRLFLVLLILFLSAPLLARDCKSRSIALFSRAINGVPEFERIAQRLATFSDNPLIVVLEKIHVEGYQRYDGITGIRHRTFNPSWVFGDPEAMELLIGQFPEGYQIAYREGQRSEFHGIPAWVEKWAQDFERHGGTLSRVWAADRNGAKRRFAQRLILELTYAFEAREAEGFSQPPGLNRAKEHPYSILAGAGEILDVFDRLELFDEAARDFFRQRKGLRTPRLAAWPTPAIRQTRAALRDLGVKKPTVRPPDRRADRKAREKQEIILVALESLRARRDLRTPLAGLTLDSSDSDDGGQNLFTFYEKVGELFGRFDNFILALNGQLDEDEQLTRAPELNWTAELVVQVGLHTALRGSSFSGFQTGEPDSPYYVNPQNSLLREARMRLFDLSKLVRQRL